MCHIYPYQAPAPPPVPDLASSRSARPPSATPPLLLWLLARMMQAASAAAARTVSTVRAQATVGHTPGRWAGCKTGTGTNRGGASEVVCRGHTHKKGRAREAGAGACQGHTREKGCMGWRGAAVGGLVHLAHPPVSSILALLCRKGGGQRVGVALVRNPVRWVGVGVGVERRRGPVEGGGRSRQLCLFHPNTCPVHRRYRC